MYDSVEISKLPRATPSDSDILIIQKQGAISYTASTSAKDLRQYIKDDIASELTSLTYYADEKTVTLDSSNIFSVKDGGIDINQLSERLKNQITGTETVLEGTYKNNTSYTQPVTAIGEFIEVKIVRTPSLTSTYAVPLYRIPGETY
jgi:hypothetical protein